MDYTAKKIAADLVEFDLSAEEKLRKFSQPVNINGYIFRHYDFFAGNKKYVEFLESEQIPEFEFDLDKRSISELQASSDFIKEQLKDNEHYFSFKFKTIQSIIRMWLEPKIEQLPIQCDVSSGQKDKIIKELYTKVGGKIEDLFGYIFWGGDEKIVFRNMFYKTIKIGMEDDSVEVNLEEMMDHIRDPYMSMLDVVDKSVDLYFRYVEIKRHLIRRVSGQSIAWGGISEKLIDRFVGNMTKDEQIKKAKHDLAGVPGFTGAVMYLTKEHSITQIKAAKIVNKFYKELFGKPRYTNLDSFTTRKNKKMDKISSSTESLLDEKVRDS